MKISKITLLTLFILNSFNSFAQMTIDTVKHTVCYGKDITLNATAGKFYKWENGSTANSQTVTSLTNNKSVEVLIYDSPQGNLVQNGNFDLGDMSFGSDYDFILSTPELQEGFYSITPDASKVHWAFKGFGKTDIAKAGTDNFMAVNGVDTLNAIVWQQTITVESNTLYAFSCWTTNLYSSDPALLQFFIDGVQLGNTFSTTMAGDWDQFYQTWSSGSQTSVTIKILNQNTTGVGNDFAIDDIYFGKIVAKKEVHKISVFKPAVDLGINKAFCASGTLDAGAGFDSYEWNTGAATQSIPVNTGGNYNIKVTKDGCEATSSVLVAINPLPVVGAISNISAMCEGDTRVLAIDNSNPSSTYTWKVSGAISNPTTGTGQTFSITAGTATIDVEVLEKDANDCISSSARTASISVDKKPTTAAVSNLGVCADAIVKTTGNQPVVGTGKWVLDVLNTSSGYSIDNLTSYNSNVTKPGLVNYGDKLTAAWEISNGVCPVSKQTMVLSFQPLSNRLFTLETDKTQICEGNEVVLTAKIHRSQVGNMPVYKLFDGLGNLVPSTPVLKDTTQAIFTLQNVTSDLNGYYVERTSNSIPCLASSLIKTTPKSVTVDQKPTKANIIEDKLVVCSAEKEINFDQLTIGTAAWSVKNGNQGNVVGTSATKAKASGLVVGQSSTFYLTASNGTCPSTKDSVLITRTGNPTTPTVKSQNDSICETAAAPKLTGTPINPSAIATETATWSSIGTAQIDNAGQTKDLVVGNNKFVYSISNGVCQPDLTDTVTFTVIKAPIATIKLPIVVNSTDNPSTKSISNLNQSIWISASQSLGYSGKWSVTNGATAIGLKGGNVSAISDSLLLKNFNDKTTATWTVQDQGKKCSEAKATLEVIRKNYNTAFAGKDTSVCISSLPFSWSGNDFNATDETATWSLVSSNPAGATVTQTGTSKNATFNATQAGVYEFEYKIVNATLNVTTKDIIKLTVDQKTTKANIVEDKLVVCSAEKEINFDQLTIGTAAWSVKNGNQGNVVGTSATKAKASGLVVGQSSTFYLTVSNGTCPSTKDSVLITRTGNPTTPSVKSQNDSICETASAPKLIGTPINSSAIATETATWSSIGTAPINNAGQTKDLVLGNNKFVYSISNGVCQPDLTDTVTITVIKAPIATIKLPIVVNSTDNPSTKSISNLNPSIWISASQSLGYSGKWSVTNGATAIGLKGGNVSAISDSLLLKNFNDKTTATWTVQDQGKKCSEAKATIEVIRKNYNSALAGKDTSVCISSLPFSWSGNDFNATDETATWSLVSSNPTGATVTQTGTSKNATFNATDAGVYEFEYKIVNNTLNVTTKDIIKLTVDQKPTKANIIEDKLVVCSAEKEINFDQLTIGTAAWTVKNGNQGNVVGTSTTKAKASGLVVGQSSTFYLTATNGTCPSTKDSVLITRTGNPTTPSVKSQNDSICETAAAPKLIGTPINSSAIATETATWSSIGTAQIDNTGQTKDLSLGNNKFVYSISNGICQPALTDTVTITVIKAPIATIKLPIVVNSTDNPSIKSISNLNSSIWISASQTAGYAGKWSVTNGANAIGLKGGNVSAISDSLLLKNFNDKTTATWTVQDEGKKCSEAQATIEVIRKNYNSALAGKDTSVCISSLPFSWSGNDFNATDETATWSLVSSNPTGATVTQTGTSKNATFNATDAGVYEFEYKIVNTLLGITTKDTIKVSVDAKPVSPTLTQPSPINTCLQKLNLPAKSAEPIPTAIGTWKFDKSQPITTQIIGTPNNANSLLENIPSGSVTKLFWVVQNGVCKKDSIALVVNQIGTITPATIRLNGTEIKGSDTSLCMSTINSLEGSTPSNDPNKGETNVWNNTGTSVSISGGTNTNQPLTLNAVGESQISYTIKNNDPNCTASVKTIKIKVNDIPVLDQITGVPNLCEGKSDSYSVSLKTGLGINTEPISAYTWNAISSATGSATLQGSGIGSSATFSFKSTSNTGSTDTASIKVIAKNACGNSLPVTKKIAIDLKPRDFVGDISGIDKACESAITAEKYTVSPQANTTSYEWTLGNKTLSGTQPMLETSIPFSELVAQKPVATLKAILSNVCGAGVEKTKSIAITPAVQVDAKISGQNSVCLPTDNMLYQGSSTNAGTNSTYTFEIIHSNNSIGKTQTSSSPDFATIKGDLEDGDKVKLTIIGNATLGCFSSTGTDELLIDGYEYPDSTITVSKDSICEGDGVIKLSVNSTFNQNNKKNDNGKIQWYVVKNNSDSLLSNLNGLYSFSISKPNESGTYKVKVPGSVCIHDSKSEQIVKIYEKPIIRVLQDPLEVIYQEGLSVPMPVAITGLKNDTISKVAWTPDTWLSAANTLDAKFVPKKEKKEIDYTLTVSTGSGSITCETQANVKVINTLPLIIPNAFSPNGDGVNDVWEIQGLTKYKSVSITVFNRWGNTVFSSKGEYTPWDGTINGIPMSVATYYAIIELKESLDNTDQTITQPLTIVR